MAAVDPVAAAHAVDRVSPHVRHRSFRRRALGLVLALVWGAAGMLVVVTLQVNPAHQLDERGLPVTHTVYSVDPALWIATFCGVALVVAVAASELGLRARRKSTAAGVVALVLGALLCLYSLFGLLYGLAALAPIGGLVLVSGTPVPGADISGSGADPATWTAPTG